MYLLNDSRRSETCRQFPRIRWLAAKTEFELMADWVLFNFFLNKSGLIIVILMFTTNRFTLTTNVLIFIFILPASVNKSIIPHYLSKLISLTTINFHKLFLLNNFFNNLQTFYPSHQLSSNIFDSLLKLPLVPLYDVITVPLFTNSIHDLTDASCFKTTFLYLYSIFIVDGNQYSFVCYT